jgi:2-phosphosulfolactate phosphatase
MDAHFTGIADLTVAPPVVVVIDVMRAFTVTAWAFDRGAEKVVLAGSREEALALKEAHPDWLTLKDGPPAPGFDLVNSPGRPTRATTRSWTSSSTCRRPARTR